MKHLSRNWFRPVDILHVYFGDEVLCTNWQFICSDDFRVFLQTTTKTTTNAKTGGKENTENAENEVKKYGKLIFFLTEAIESGHI